MMHEEAKLATAAIFRLEQNMVKCGPLLTNPAVM